MSKNTRNHGKNNRPPQKGGKPQQPQNPQQQQQKQPQKQQQQQKQKEKILRLFFCGELPDEQRAKLVEIQNHFKSQNVDVKWVEPENLHLTLCFLGEIKERRLGELEKLGRDVSKLYGSFDMSLKGIGTFPPKGPPKVLWIGIEEGKKNISMLAGAIESRIANFKPEFEFQAHLTLGRFRNENVPEQTLIALTTTAFETPSWHFDSFLLRESTLTPAGPSYKTVFNFPLAPKDRIIQEPPPRVSSFLRY